MRFIPLVARTLNRTRSGLGEAVQTLNNASSLEQLGVKTQREICEKKRVRALLILLPIALTCLHTKKKGSLLFLPPRRHHGCTLSHITRLHFSVVVTDFLNEMSVNEWRAVERKERCLSGSGASWDTGS